MTEHRVHHGRAALLRPDHPFVAAVPMVRFTRVEPLRLGFDVTALAKELEAGT